MIELTVKNIIIKKQLNFFFKVPGVLFCTTVSMRIGWFTDVPPERRRSAVHVHNVNRQHIGERDY